jgi:UDP-glucose 4-epimerase
MLIDASARDAMLGDQERKTALVTGATGFIGRHVAATLRRHGWQVRATLQRPSAAMGEGSVVIGAITADTDWRAALEGVDAVIHLAARAHRPPAVQEAQRELYFETNTKATLQLARAAAAAGTRRFFFMSSIAVNGSSTDGRLPFREGDDPAPKTVYGDSKTRAEQGLGELSGASRMSIVIARPPMVYGAGARGNFSLLVRAVSAGIPLPFRSIANRRAFLAVENLADFVLHSLSLELHGCETFIVADDEPLSTPEFVRRLAHALGRKPHLFPMPISALAMLARAAGRAETIDSLCMSLEVDLQKAHASGWRPPLTPDQAMALAVNETGSANSFVG